MSSATPRINFKYLSQFEGKTIRIIGKVGEKQGNNVILHTTDNGQVIVDRSKNLEKNYQTNIVEVLGIWNNNQLSELTFFNLSDNFDFTTYNQMIDLSMEHKEIFM
ncbi:replication protein a3 [Anaeramoeba flamelloides]|uniref:Replication protein a3 n=1 Tax=Anaeramoeba flamelloides TaxID=1746091 RepID=A0AAV7ZSB6_9EUKA|nr:replication protein a3 [Anaeramoeba flamelloides]